MSAELEVLEDALARLEREGIPYMLTGSLASSYYAEPRMTRDIDLVAELSGGDAKRLTALFEPDYYVSEADVERALRDRGMFNVLHLEKLVKLDLIVRKDEPFRRHEFGRRVRVLWREEGVQTTRPMSGAMSFGSTVDPGATRLVG